jgi:hypothetical protein
MSSKNGELEQLKSLSSQLSNQKLTNSFIIHNEHRVIAYEGRWENGYGTRKALVKILQNFGLLRDQYKL